MIEVPKNVEYFFLQCRQHMGYDSEPPGVEIQGRADCWSWRVSEWKLIGLQEGASGGPYKTREDAVLAAWRLLSKVTSRKAKP